MHDPSLFLMAGELWPTPLADTAIFSAHTMSLFVARVKTLKPQENWFQFAKTCFQNTIVRFKNG